MSVLILLHASIIVMYVLTLSHDICMNIIHVCVDSVTCLYHSHNLCVDSVTCLSNSHVCVDSVTCLNNSHVCVDIVTCLHHCHSVKLHAWLSSTFLQTLPGLAWPLRGTAYLPTAVHRRCQRPPKVWNLIRLLKQHSVQACT